MKHKRLHAEIFGRVQGVGFRMFVQERARALGLKGTVRNLYFPRRKVEVIAEGPETGLEQLLDLLHEGPSSARVDDVETEWRSASGEFSEFAIL